MALLEPTAPHPHPMRRVLVAGNSGAGKTTLARALQARLGLPHTEIDSLHHGPSWTARPEFLDDVAALAARPAWVTEWQYAAARPLLAAAADTIVWLDLPTRTVMLRLIRRTIRRRLVREQLWNGNYEPPLHTFFTDHDHIVRWAWRTRHTFAARMAAEHRAHPHLVIVRISSRRQLAHWLAAFGEGSPT
jgi:adenylate kinase family enzyme